MTFDMSEKQNIFFHTALWFFLFSLGIWCSQLAAIIFQTSVRWWNNQTSGKQKHWRKSDWNMWYVYIIRGAVVDGKADTFYFPDLSYIWGETLLQVWCFLLLQFIISPVERKFSACLSLHVCLDLLPESVSSALSWSAFINAPTFPPWGSTTFWLYFDNFLCFPVQVTPYRNGNTRALQKHLHPLLQWDIWFSTLFIGILYDRPTQDIT